MQQLKTTRIISTLFKLSDDRVSSTPLINSVVGENFEN